ncbi:hypothetical protein OIU77_022267 [Salix suchowensis]|uniref:Uncharacterized protein n=1 Tax=Salix suchowensis TaxID=1278906 RepID=A0ABQ9BZP5_9ROSI|nr:hypothetical protein OIU77_022267 [Salix suchowensis]
MGADGVSSPNIKRVPSTKPPFTLGQVKKAIPPHCFERSLLRSFSYVVYDLLISSLLGYIATTSFHLLPSHFAYVAWPIYWILQGCVLTGLWVIAHECGHHAFSDHQWIDDTVGLLLHSALFVPYFSWKYSHRRHHSNIGCLDRDEVFVPKLKSQIPWHYMYLNNPPGRALGLAVKLLLGWPLYLSFNASGRPYDRFACHYDPYSPIYSDRERLHIYISDLGIFRHSICALPHCYNTRTSHTHPSLPHYDSAEWDWLRGALVTVDRDYGILNKVFHNITDTHVAHHLVATVPHYHAMEATEAIKPVLGEFYQFDSTPFYKALWREARECLYVEPDEKGVFWFMNKF